MNLILLFPDDFIPSTDRVSLTGRRQQHVLAVHQAVVGQELLVGLLNGEIGRGLVTRLTDDVLEMLVRWERRPPAPLPVTLVLALPRPTVLKRVLQTVSSMGVKRIFLIHGCRVEKTYWQSHALREDEIRHQLILGLEQARDTVMPEVQLRPRFKPFAEDELPQLTRGARCFLADPEIASPCPQGVTQASVMAVGPEGGFVEFEVRKFRELGFEMVQVGQRTLRVEAAVPALLGKIFL